MPDYYPLTYVTAGWASADGSLFYSEDQFYLRVVPDHVPDADINGDGSVDGTDYAALISALSGPNEPAASSAADLDDDGDCDLQDVSRFFVAFSGN